MPTTMPKMIMDDLIIMNDLEANSSVTCWSSFWGDVLRPSARSDEQVHEPTFVRSTVCARVLLVDVVVLFLASLVQEVGREQAAQAPVVSKDLNLPDT